MHDLRDKVVVLTGASSRIGRAAALQFAARQSTLVLSGRRREELEELAQTCRDAGAEVLVVLADVIREADVQTLADTAVHRLGRIDVWINNAGVSLFAPLGEGAFELHRRVIETNLYGAILGARAILPIFHRQGHGTLINVGANLRRAEHAFTPAYAVIRSALFGLSESLRVELGERPGMHVCTLLPYGVETPLTHATSPERVAEALVRLAERPRRVRHVPRTAAIGLALHAMLPNMCERIAGMLRGWGWQTSAPESA